MIATGVYCFPKDKTLNLNHIEKAKTDCTKKLFADLSTEDVVYHDVDSYQSLLNIMESL